MKFLQKVTQAITKFFTGIFGPKAGSFLASVVNAPFNFLLNSFHYIAQGDYKGLIKYWGKVAVQVALMVFVAIVAPYLLGVLFAFVGAFLGFIGGFLGAVGGFLANTIPLLGQVIGGALQLAGKFLVQAGQFLSRVGAKLMTQSRQLFHDLREQGLKGVFQSFKDRFFEKLNPLAKIEFGTFRPENIPAHPWITNHGLGFVARESSKIVQKSLLERVTDFVQKFSLQFLQQKIDQKLEKTKMNSFVRSLLSSFTGAALGAVTGALISSAAQTLAPVLGSVTNLVGQGLNYLYQGGKAILSTIDRGLQALGQGIGRAFEGVKSFFSNIAQKIHGTRGPPVNAPSYDGRNLRDPFGNARITLGDGAFPGERIAIASNSSGDPNQFIRGPQSQTFDLTKVNDLTFRADTGEGNFTEIKYRPHPYDPPRIAEIGNLKDEEFIKLQGVKKAFRKVAEKSEWGTPREHEMGGNILANRKGRIRTEWYPAGTVDRTQPIIHPSGRVGKWKVAGSFHTHPSSSDYYQPPSPQDQILVSSYPKSFGKYHFVVTKEKIYSIDTATGDWREVGLTDELLS